SGWLVVTMPWVAMTSARLWAAQPSARSPRTAVQAAAGGRMLHTDIGGRDWPPDWPSTWAHPCDEATSAIAAPMTAHARVVAFPMAFSRAAAFLSRATSCCCGSFAQAVHKYKFGNAEVGASAQAPPLAGAAGSSRTRPQHAAACAGPRAQRPHARAQRLDE